MGGDILVRILYAAVIVLAMLGFYRLVAYLSIYRVQGKQHAEHAVELFQPGKPAILYFTTPDCAPCRTIQRPALNRVQSRLGDRLQVVEVNTYERPELAKEWGVLSVPTTFIIDASGRPRHVNHGVTPADKLLEQLTKFS
jgi:thiol-disulfide isomerase/thioredoxin